MHNFVLLRLFGVSSSCHRLLAVFLSSCPPFSQIKIIPCEKRKHLNAALKEASHSAALDSSLVARAIDWTTVDPRHLTDEQKQMLHQPNHMPARMTQEQLETWEQVWLIFEFCSEGDLRGQLEHAAEMQRRIDQLPVCCVIASKDDEKDDKSAS
jgi:hypothetical protein